MKTAEDILFDTMTDGNFTYVSFPAFVENESSVDVFDIAIKAIEAYAALAVAEATKDCYPKEFLLWTGFSSGMLYYRDIDETWLMTRFEMGENPHEEYDEYTTDELFDYWTKNIKK